MRRRPPCVDCDPFIQNLTRENTHLKYENAHLEEQLSEWKKSSFFWENKYKNSAENNNFNWLDVDSDYCTPEKLELSAFGNYLDDIVKKFPILQIILFFFTSASYTCKHKANTTKEEWIQWSDWYWSFICDMFLRARSLKSIRRSNLMISVYFLLTNMPEPIWRVLEHLRIVVSKQVVESWIKSHVKEIKSDESFLIVSFDNCSWNLHVTHTRTNNRSMFMHIITWFVVEIKEVLLIPAEELWMNVNQIKFGH